MRHYVPYLFGLLVIAAIMRIDLFFTVVYFLAALIIVSRLWINRITPRVRLEREFEGRAFVGDAINVVVRFKNTTWLPVAWLQAQDSVPTWLSHSPPSMQVLNLPPRGERAISYSLRAGRRGYYELGPMHAETGDLLGLAQSEINWPTEDHIIVYPRVVPLSHPRLPALASYAHLRSHSPLIEDPSRIMGTRAYLRGDSPRRIHWTASAHTSSLLVKQYDPAIARDTLIALNLTLADYARRGRYDAAELAIVVAASLANHIIVRDGLSVGLLLVGHHVPSNTDRQIMLAPRAEHAHLLQILETLATAELSEEGNFVSALRDGSVRLSWGATILAITGLASTELMETLSYLQRCGFSVVLYVVGADAPVDPGKVPVRIIRGEADIEAWR